MANQNYTIGFIAVQQRTPPSVVELLIQAAGVKPCRMDNDTRFFSHTELGPVYSAIESYHQGVSVDDLVSRKSEPVA